MAGIRPGGRRHRWVALASLAVVISAAACGTTANGGGTTVPIHGSSSTSGSQPATSTTSKQPVVSTPPSTGAASLASCTLPLTHNAYDGYHIAVPTSWDLASLNGTVEAENNTSATEAVVVIPALETGGLTASSFFEKSIQYVEKQTRSGGSTINVTTGTSSNGTPDASFTARVNGVNLEGKATVEVLPLVTNLATSEVVFIAYWAPAASFSGDESMLSSIGRCYGPEKATLFRVFQDQVFTYVMPPGWSVSGENQNGIILNLGDTADVTYLLAEVIPASEAGSAEGLIRYYLGTTGLTNVHTLWVTSSPSQTEVSGAIQQTAFEEFTGTIKGVADHGLIYGTADTAAGLTSGVVRMALSTAGTWNGLSSGLIQMAGFIQHKFTQDLEQLQNLNREWQAFSGQVQDFDDVLNEQQLVRDPLTGVYYEAPYSSYEPEGPQGGGYYVGTHLLDPVSRS